MVLSQVMSLSNWASVASKVKNILAVAVDVSTDTYNKCKLVFLFGTSETYAIASPVFLNSLSSLTALPGYRRHLQPHLRMFGRWSIVFHDGKQV